MFVVRVTDLELDEGLLMSRIAAAEQVGLKIMGFQTMARARASIRPGVGPSRPGSPPHDHTGALRRFLGYDVDPATKSMVAGPRQLSRRSENAPRALESGEASRNAHGQAIRVKARPFMVPAFYQACRQELPAAFSDKLR